MFYHYLSHLAELGTADIHPLGHRATRVLIETLDLQIGHRVLEIGCGTGNTAILISQSAGVEVVGLDILPQMLSAARKRVRWSGSQEYVHILQAGSKSLPFYRNSFARIYTESVLGFQGRGLARSMLAEIHRTLRPGGLYVANEAIWKHGVSQATVDAIHDSGVDDFGLGQASPQAWSLEGWSDAMQQTGFTILSAGLLETLVSGISPVSASRKQILPLTGSLLRLRLGVFSSFYRMKRLWNARLRRERQIYKKRLQKHSQDGQYIEGRLFVLRKSDLV